MEAVSIWLRLARKFGPLVGPSSVKLIMARSVESNLSGFPWLASVVHRPDLVDPPYSALLALMEERQPSDVVAATRAMLSTYIYQLTTLIGLRLTEQFLRAAFPGDGDDQDNRSETE
jgi:hypothetical protein